MAVQSGAPFASRHARGHLTPALALLSFAAGSMDAIAFLALGEVFTSAMSGNTVLLGVALGQGRLSAALHSLTAVGGYVTGVAVASFPPPAVHRGHWKLGLETVFLAGFAALWLAGGGPKRAAMLYGLIALSAIAMGLQGALGRTLGIPGIMTVIFTSTYTAIVSGIAERARARERPLVTDLALRQLTVLLVYLGSAILAGVAVRHQLPFMAFVPLAVILVLLLGLKLGLVDLGPRWS